MKLTYLSYTKGWLLITITFSALSYLQAVPVAVKKAIDEFDQNELEKAQNIIDTAIQDLTIAEDPSTWYYRGVIYEQLMRKNITTDSANLYLDQALLSYHKITDKSNKDRQFDSFAKINLQNIWAYYLNRGVQYYKIESFAEALKQFTIAQQICEEPIENLLYTTIASHQLEKYDIAIQGYQQYIQRCEAVAPTYQALAHLTAQNLYQPVEALQILDIAQQKYPWNTVLLSERYDICQQTGQLVAEKNRLKALLADPLATTAAYYQAGYFASRSGELEQATTYYQKVLDLFPKQIDTLVQLGILYYNESAKIIREINALSEEEFQKKGKEGIEKAKETLQTSLQYFEKTIKLAPKNIYLLKTLHIIYTYLKKPETVNQIVKRLKGIKGGLQVLEQ